MTTSYQSLLDSLKYDSNNLIPAIIQDHQTKDVLMMGYMNQDALLKTLKGPHVCFYSRSKQRLWVKGESSGHTQIVKEIRLDCDKDTLLIFVDQNVAACHKGYRTCFYQKITEGGKLEILEKKVFEP